MSSVDGGGQRTRRAKESESGGVCLLQLLATTDRPRLPRARPAPHNNQTVALLLKVGGSRIIRNVVRQPSSDAMSMPNKAMEAARAAPLWPCRNLLRIAPLHGQLSFRCPSGYR